MLVLAHYLCVWLIEKRALRTGGQLTLPLVMLGIFGGTASADAPAPSPPTTDGAIIAIVETHLEFEGDGDIAVATVKNLTNHDVQVQISLEADAMQAGFMLVPNRTIIGPYGDRGSGGNNTVTIPANGWVPQIITFDGGPEAEANPGSTFGHLTVTVGDGEKVLFKGQAVLEAATSETSSTSSAK